MNPISTTSHPSKPPTRSDKRRTVMGECTDKNCEKTLGTATASRQQANEHCKPTTVKKPLSRLVNHRNKINSIQVNYKQQTKQRGVAESAVNLRRRFACCKLAAAKSICRHRSCKALSSSLPSSSAKKSSKALANLHNVTTNFVLGVGSQARPEEGGDGDDKTDVKNNFEKLMLSLQSPLPNEHTLTLNTLTILSSVVRDKELNILERTPALLNMILAHVGFYNDCALRLLMEQTFGEYRDFTAFWQGANASEAEEVLELRQQLLCECFPREDNFDNEGKCCEGCVASRVQISVKQPPNVALPVETEKVGGQVQRIGHILRNLSFQDGNASQMAMNATMLRFLLVAGTSEYGSLPQISFDIISNITKYIVLMPLSSVDKGARFQLQAILVDLVTSTFLNSGDRFRILRCLEALQGLAVSSSERDTRLRIFKDVRLFEKLFQFLTLKEDTILVINCLECLLAATAEEMGKPICDKIMESIRGCIGTLVSYLTVNVMENFAKTEPGFRNEKFRTELVGTKGSLLGSKPVKKNISNEAMSKVNKVNGCVGNQSCVKSQSSSVIPTSAPKQSSLGNSSTGSLEESHIAPSSSPQKKLGPFDEAAIIMDNVKKIPEGKPITLMLSIEALSLLERKPELRIKPLDFSTNNLNSSTNIDCSKKVCVELVYHQNNNFLKKTNGIVCPYPVPSSPIPFLVAPSLNNILETSIPYLCEWDYCGSRHLSKIQLRWHVYLWHIPINKADKGVCKWRSRTSTVERCNYPRNKDCLLKHLMDHHYNDKALDQALLLRINRNNISAISPSIINFSERDHNPNGVDGDPTTPALSYGCLQQPETEEQEEHVVNKSVRLTAALILRNLAKNSGPARRSLKQYEMKLTEVAVSGYDCSGIISHVLHYLSEDDHDKLF